MYQTNEELVIPQDPQKKELLDSMNQKVTLAEIQLAAWKQKKIINRLPVSHNNVLIFCFPKYAYDYSQPHPAYLWLTLFWNIKKQTYGLQLQQEMFDEHQEGITLYHKIYPHENSSLANMVTTGFKIHQEIGKEVEEALYPDFESMRQKLEN